MTCVNNKKLYSLKIFERFIDYGNTNNNTENTGKACTKLMRPHYVKSCEFLIYEKVLASPYIINLPTKTIKYIRDSNHHNMNDKIVCT